MDNKKSNEIVIRESQNIFQKFDELDDQIIINELENRVVEEWVYHFKPEGAPEVWGIGKAGIDGCSTEMGKKGIALREEKVDVIPDPTNAQYVLCSARVSKHYVGKDGAEAMIETAIGTKRQWTKMKLRNGDIVTDPFWYEKGTIKALRNAKSRLIPEDIKAKIIAFAKQHKKVKEIKPTEKTRPITKKTNNNSAPQIASNEQKSLVAEKIAMLIELGVEDINEKLRADIKKTFMVDTENIPGDITSKMAEWLLKKLDKEIQAIKNPGEASEPPLFI